MKPPPAPTVLGDAGAVLYLVVLKRPLRSIIRKGVLHFSENIYNFGNKHTNLE